MPLRPRKVGAVGCKGDCPSLTSRLLVEWGSRHQEFTDELGLICERETDCGYLSRKKASTS